MSESTEYTHRFDQIQKALDNDPTLSRKFLTDPVDFLEDYGVILAPDLAAKLRTDVIGFRKPVVAPESIHIVKPSIGVSIHPPGISIKGGIKTT
jgi:hypothetical protein